MNMSALRSWSADRLGLRPVSNPKRDGVQIDEAEYHEVNFTPSFASRSMCGVGISLP